MRICTGVHVDPERGSWRCHYYTCKPECNLTNLRVFHVLVHVMCVYVYGEGGVYEDEGAIRKPSIGDVGTGNPQFT